MRAPGGRAGGAAAGPGLAALALGTLLGGALSAQDAGDGPLPRLTFDLGPRLELDGDGAVATTALGLGFVDVTRTERFDLAARSGLRLDGDGLAARSPALSFGYDREGADASLSVDGSLRRDEVGDADLSGLVGSDGEALLPPDLVDLDGVGTRREASLAAVLSLREDRPLSFTLRAAVSDLDYEGVVDPDLRDARRLSLGASARLLLGGGRTATVGLAFERLEEGGEVDEDLGLDLGLSAERPGGALSAGLSLDATDDGPRVGLSFGRSLALPTGSLSGSLGLARGANGDVVPTVELSFRREDPRGALDVALSSALRSGDDGEELATSLRAGLDRALGPRASLSLDALLASLEPTGEGEGEARAELGATLSYALTPDWTLQTGLGLALAREGGEREREATAFVGLSRRFTVGF